MLKSRLPDVHLEENIPLSEFVLRRAREYGDRIALIDGQTDRKLSYNELLRQIRSVGSALYRRGLRKGDVVMAFATNCIEYVVLFHAVVGQGAILTTANYLYTAAELVIQLQDSDTVYIFTQNDLLDQVRKALKTYKKNREIIVPGGAPGCIHFEALTKDDGSAFPKVHIDPKTDIAVLPYSSGTTGRAKGVMLTHYQLVSNMCQALTPHLTFYPQGATCVFVMPLFHMYGVFGVMEMGLYQGGTTVLIDRFQFDAYLRMIVKYKVDFLHVVPPIALLLAKDPRVDNYDLSRLKCMVCGAASLSGHVIKELHQRLPNFKTMIQAYGMTELSPVTHASLPSAPKDGSIGVTIPNTWAKVVDTETGNILGPNQTGELCVKGPQVMKGYLNNLQATVNTIESDGWLHTGDIAYYDEDENFYIVDRLKELIKFKGSQVPPAELEAILVKHPAIADAAVVGVPDDLAGELPRAYVVKHQGASITSKEVQDYVKENLNPHMWLRGGVVFVPEVPKSASGKILRRLLKDQILKEQNTKSKL